MSLEVEDIMIKDVVTIDEEATVKEAVELMNKHEIGCLVAMKKEKPSGILTERDLLRRVLGKSKDPENTKVSKVMSKPIVVGKPKMEVEEAVRLMFKMKIKKLPVVEKGRLLGLITLTDLVRFQPQMISIIKKLSINELTPKRMKKVVDYYIA
ncbi:MAG: CBS domain-containing protein [Candidatus Bathyarchaeota archaeon]|nr:CBS domain-containing protein [Candidatus Bathyarchaeota archaeon]MDH5532632.1 CBS domain-containing protein [Candidatus Bathyarchaeota archaeon]MDH5713383.1 CBS domain-containing protein [Candidatus Bathyarchaeota archaeon]